MNVNRYLFKINRLCAWMLLVFMILFLVSGYAWVDKIVMPVQQARWLHTQLDTYLVIFFLLNPGLNEQHHKLNHRECLMTFRADFGL